MNESTTATNGALRTLYRHPTQRVLAGVAGGIADWLGWDVVVVRLLWVVLFFATSGAAVPVYIVLALLLPTGTQIDGPVRRAPIHFGMHASKPLALVLIGVGLLWLLSNLGILPGLASAFFSVVRVAFWPLLLIFVGWRILLALGVRFNSGKTAEQVEGWSRSAAAWGAETGAKMGEYFNTSQERTSYAATDASQITSQSTSTDPEGAASSRAMSAVSLTRSSNDRILAGVCGGIARRYQMDPSIVRLLWAMVSLATLGLGVLAYVAAAMLLPVEGAASTPSASAQASAQASVPASAAATSDDGTQEIAIQRDETLTL